MFEVAHASGERLHLAQALVHLLQPVGHLLEAFTQAGLQRALQLLIHGGPHLVQLFLIAVLQGCQALLHDQAHFTELALAALGHLAKLLVQALGKTLERDILRVARRSLRGRQLLLCRPKLNPKRIDLLILRARHIAGLRQQRLLKQGQRLRQFRSAVTCAALHLAAQLALHALTGGGQPGNCAQQLGRGSIRARTRSQHQPQHATQAVENSQRQQHPQQPIRHQLASGMT